MLPAKEVLPIMASLKYSPAVTAANAHRSVSATELRIFTKKSFTSLSQPCSMQ